MEKAMHLFELLTSAALAGAAIALPVLWDLELRRAYRRWQGRRLRALLREAD